MEKIIIKAEEDNINERLGIPTNAVPFHKILKTQDRYSENLRTNIFIEQIISKYPNIFSPNTKFEFINYGDTELVYVLDDKGIKKTLLIGQPNLPKGTVKTEYENLQKLGERFPNLVITPINYFSNEHREAYLTPYLYQARCIASQTQGYGVYIPEPFYRFENFTDEDSYQICKVIIANLIRLYDADLKLALAECKIGGGDFILEKEYDNEPHTEANTLKRMHLIAARKLINIELKDYIKMIKREFTNFTYYSSLEERDANILINLKNRFPMTRETVEDGIELGLKLKENTGHINITI